MGIEQKTLSELEGSDWGKAPDQDSYIERSSFDLRHKPIGEMTVEDLRLLIGQGIGLQYLVPKVLELLDRNPLVAGMHYPGDLLVSTLRLPQKFLDGNPELVSKIERIIERVPPEIQKLDDIDRRYANEALEEVLPRFRRKVG